MSRVRKVVVGLVVAAAAGVGLGPIQVHAEATSPITWYVEKGAPIPSSSIPCPARSSSHPRVGSVTSAVKCALGGDTISISAAKFVDHVVVNKNLTITGAGPTSSLIDGAGKGAVLTIPAGNFVRLSNVGLQNGFNGLVVVGGVAASHLASSANKGNGIFVSTGSAVSIGPDIDVHHNQLDGLRIVQATGARLVLAGERATVRSNTVFHDNTGNGVSVGIPYTTTAPPLIKVRFSDIDITANARGVSVRDDGGTARTDVVMLDNDVYQNRAEGLFAGRSVIGQSTDPAVLTPTFAQNKFHCNDGNQIVFDGGGGTGDPYPFPVDSPSHLCDAGSNATYCNAAKNVFGIFAQGNSSVTVRHTQFEGGGTGLKDFSYQSGSAILVSSNCTAITTCP